MATINGLTAETMQEIRDAVIVGATVDGDNLILLTYGGGEINAGSVRGPQGDEGPIGQVSDAELAAAVAALNATISAAHAAGAITSTQLAASSVTTGKINDGAVTEAKLANGAVTFDKIAVSSVENTKIGNNAVSNEKIGAQAVDARTLANGAITEVKLNAGMCTEFAGAALNSWGGAVYYWKAGNMVFFIYQTTTGNAAIAQPIFQFPSGFRPFRTYSFPCYNDSVVDVVWVDNTGTLRGNTSSNFLYTCGHFLAFS